MTVLSLDPDEIGRQFGEEPPPEVGPSMHELPHALLVRNAPPTAPRRLYRLSELANLKSAAGDAVIGGGILARGGKLLDVSEPELFDDAAER